MFGQQTIALGQQLRRLDLLPATDVLCNDFGADGSSHCHFLDGFTSHYAGEIPQHFLGVSDLLLLQVGHQLVYSRADACICIQPCTCTVGLFG